MERMSVIKNSGNKPHERGFSLIEVMVAGFILTVGLLALAYGYGQVAEFAMSGGRTATAQQKAQEAIDNVEGAYYGKMLTWGQFENDTNGGVFLSGCRSLTTAGPDGIVDTADDGSVETITLPGPDGEMADGTVLPLTMYVREIQITDLGSNLKQVVVTVFYTTPSGGGSGFAPPACPSLSSPHYQVTSDVFNPNNPS